MCLAVLRRERQFRRWRRRVAFGRYQDRRKWICDRTRPYREQPAWQLQRHRFGYDLSRGDSIYSDPFSLTNNVPVGSTMTPSGTPQSIPTLGVFAPLQVTVKDASNNPIVGAGVKFQVNTLRL